MDDTTPTPTTIFRAFTAYQSTAMLKTAIELGVFTAVGQGATTLEALAEACKASPRGLRALCSRLVVEGLLTKTGDHYGVPMVAAMFLDRHSAAYLGDAIRFLTNASIVDAFENLTGAVRRGGASDADATTVPDNAIWVDFARAMAGLASVSAEGIAAILGAARADRPWKILDVAAGHGMYGIALARYNPKADVVALDWPAVLAVAEENARAAGVADRHRLLPGDAFSTDLGSGYDIVLLTNFLHHFDVPTCEKFLGRVRNALAPGGRAVAAEFVPNDDRVSPPEAAAFALTMLATTPSGDAYTFAEYDKMFRAAGFSRTEMHELPPTPQRAVIAER